ATVDDWSQGVPLDYTRELCQYWLEAYDWRACESRLNGFPQFRTGVDGLDIHFLHVRSPREDALPLVITHGWPGSIVEFGKVIGPLTDPGAHGGDPADAFHVVCPSLPGYGFSGKPSRPGWGTAHTGDAWDQLMTRLGYPRYAAQGGDWGAQVTTAIGARHPDHLVGIHLNMPAVAPDPATLDDLTEREKAAIATMEYYRRWDSGYSKQQSTRPQTIGYSLVDSPAGLCAWIIEKFWSWTDCDGDPANVLTRDEMLDNVMMYWLPGTGASSARLYWESFRTPIRGTVTVPVGCSIFPKEIFRPSRRWAERQFPDLRYWNEPATGGHFAAFEQPETFVNEVRAAFRPLR
ncbi:MAG: epoxide hydrolase, partial [Actinomycetia bacterium]|nr:epoxide hydrolase [Actinomycetes bacterium]